MMWYKIEFDDTSIWRKDFKYHECSGVYLFCFNSGKRYLGKTVNLGDRLHKHFMDFRKSRDWHKEVGYTGQDLWRIVKDFNQQHEILFYPCENCRELESELLQKIKENGRCDEYYNTQWK